MPWLSVNQTRLAAPSAVPTPLLALEVHRARMPGQPGAYGHMWSGGGFMCGDYLRTSGYTVHTYARPRDRRRRDTRQGARDGPEATHQDSVRADADCERDGEPRAEGRGRRRADVRRGVDRLSRPGRARTPGRQPQGSWRRVDRFQFQTRVRPPRQSRQRRGDAGAREL